MEVYEKVEIFHVCILFAGRQIFGANILVVFVKERRRPTLRELLLGFRF